MVCGFCGTGKTLVARQVEEFLAAKGYEVDRVPDDDEVSWNTSQKKLKTDALQDSGLEIVVKTVQLKRSMDGGKRDKTTHDNLAAIDEVDVSKEG
jgi:hypothetical protein